MLTRIDCNEEWPVYSLHDPLENSDPDFIVDLSEEFINRFLAIQDEYRAMQTKLKEFYERCEKRRQERTHSADQKLWADMYENHKRVHGSSSPTGRFAPPFLFNKIRPDAI